MFNDIAPTCQLANADSSTLKVHLVFQTCTALSYTIISNATANTACLLRLRTATLKNTLFVFRVNILRCPLVFYLDNYKDICGCDPKLEAE